jgi:uncharacterized protein with HEPN domain
VRQFVQPRLWTFRVDHILSAIARARRYTNGISFEEFESNELLIDAVVRTFVVIGEAARHIPMEVAARYPQLPIADMRAMRNVVVHDYDNVRLVTLWETVRDDLPPLIPILQGILDRESASDTGE